MRRPSHVPTKAPAIPSSIVIHIPPGSLPGMINFAREPTMRPIRAVQSKLNIQVLRCAYSLMMRTRILLLLRGRRLWGIFFNGAERLDTTSNSSMSEKVIDAGVRVGHVHLKVSDLERALGFYRDVLGFEVTQRMGDSAAFLSAGGYHHHIGLNTWDSAGGSAPAAGTTGLYHLAIVYPTRAKLGDALRRLIEAH